MFPVTIVPLVTADALCSRLRAQHQRAPSGAIVSDGDGTLWKGDVGDALFDFVLEKGGFLEAAREALLAEVRSLGLPAAGDANTLALVLREAYRTGIYDEGRYFAMQAWAFAGWREAELGTTCADVLDRFGFDDGVRAGMRRVLGWCQEVSVPFFIVSASPEAIVDEAARRLGLDRGHVLAMRPAIDGGVVQPLLAATATYGKGKVARLGERLGDVPVLAAFGDNIWDAAMLERAALAVMVAPKPALRERMVLGDGSFELVELELG